MTARLNFQANDSDVFLTSSMKTGTTWLKAIIPTIMNPIGRMDDDKDDPLLKRHPNELMPSLEVQLFKENPNPDLSYILERLKNLEVNQYGADPWLGFEYKFYFRRGSVGDWKNNMSNEMKEKLDHITAMKFEGSVLGFGN
ncbi:hypothetical protein J1N35_003929 [Gossypium stocksii]|uniref:Sulfotransferase n=1 Tax=Gossypium stocksii TaxID=47602 RepID=A0A9D4AH69_9ROSI|nr:hypothetical protein J1N35_003929 [Gossypium stocksii]